jgi:hypothetical protein
VAIKDATYRNGSPADDDLCNGRSKLETEATKRERGNLECRFNCNESHPLGRLDDVTTTRGGGAHKGHNTYGVQQLPTVVTMGAEKLTIGAGRGGSGGRWVRADDEWRPNIGTSVCPMKLWHGEGRR